MLDNSLPIDFGKWLLWTGLPWIGAVMLIAPLATSLSNRRRRLDLMESRKGGSDLLLSEWANIVKPIVNCYLSLEGASNISSVGSLNQKAHDDIARGMELQTARIAEVKTVLNGQTERFTQYTNHLSQAECALRRCEIAGEDFLHQTGILTSVVDPEELIALLVIRRHMAEAIRCARSMVRVIQDARACRSAAAVRICDYRVLNDKIRNFSAMLVAEPPKGQWIVRFLDYLFARRKGIAKGFEDYFGISTSKRKGDQEKDEDPKHISPETFEDIQKHLPSVEDQRELADGFLDHFPFLSWIADLARWEEELRKKQPTEPTGGAV